MAQSKATKKFEKKHLKDTLKRRKDFAKVKQRHRLKDKKAVRQPTEDNDAQTSSSRGQDGSKRMPSKAALEDMTVDDFFAGGFDIANDAVSKAQAPKRSGKRKLRDDNGDDEDSSVASVEDHAAAASSSEDGDDESQDELAKHKDDLQALSKSDPEFYKYLQENDPELLEAAETSDFPQMDDMVDADDDVEGAQKTKGKGASTDVSKAMVKRWSTALDTKQSLRALRELVIAFRAAVHANDQTDKTYKYTISNADAYHEVLLCALRQLPPVLHHHIPVKKLTGGRETVPTENAKFRALSTLLKSHALAILHLLENLSDPGTTRTALDSIAALVPYLLSFKKMVRDVTRVVVEIWADSAQDEATRISAFLILQAFGKNGDPGIRDTVLRTAYQGLLKGCRNTNIHTIAAINLTKNTAVDLWTPMPGKDGSTVPYTTAFTFIRSLALHLRNCIKHNANDAYKTVYNWQYLHALDFWSRVLSTHCASLNEATSGRESPLRPLIYPFVQVTLGALRLIPTSAYFPLRFHCLRALLRLSAATNTFIPLAAPLFEVLSSAEMRKPPKPLSLKPLDFDVTIRASKNYLKTRIYQDGVGEQVVELFSEFFTLWAKNIAFPELALPAVVMIKRWLKEMSPYNAKGDKSARGKKLQTGNRNTKLNSSLSLLIQKIEANTRFVEDRRAQVDFAPNDRAGVENFLKDLDWTKTPLGAFVEGQRKVREERRKLLEEERKTREETREARRNGKRSGGKADDDDDDDDGLELEDEIEDEDEMELDGEDDVGDDDEEELEDEED